jgi:geranylgeranyl pyrophosphate synthase
MTQSTGRKVFTEFTEYMKKIRLKTGELSAKTTEEKLAYYLRK